MDENQTKLYHSTRYVKLDEFVLLYVKCVASEDGP